MAELHERFAGAKFRPVSWDRITSKGAKRVGFGIEAKRVGSRRYTPVGYQGKVHPFNSEREARKVCERLNEIAKKMLEPLPPIVT